MITKSEMLQMLKNDVKAFNAEVNGKAIDMSDEKTVALKLLKEEYGEMIARG